MRLTTVALAAFGMTNSALAEPELHFIIESTDGANYTLYAELYNPSGSILAAVADLGFTLTGTNIDNFSYNSAFDSDFFGPATATVTSSSIDFVGGNTLPPLNNFSGVDSSNPLSIASFTADSIDRGSFDLVGQVTGAYTGVPFPEVVFYQNADGSDGDAVWCHFFFCTPTPGTATAGFLAALALTRRSRS